MSYALPTTDSFKIKK